MGVGVTCYKTAGSSGPCPDKPEQMRGRPLNNRFPEESEGHREQLPF